MMERNGDPPTGDKSPERSANPRKILLRIGLGLFPGLSGLLLITALLAHHRQGWGEPGPVTELLYLLVATAALPGLASLMIVGFTLLVTGGEAGREPGELLGEARPAGFRRKNDPVGVKKADLRQLWSPFLIYLACSTTARVIWFFRTKYYGVPILLPEWVFSLLDGLQLGAIVFFLYFWLAGLVRINRSGLRIPDLFKFWLFLALILFIIPLIFLSNHGFFV